MPESLKSLRKRVGMTQPKAADYFQVSLRTYKTYENDLSKVDTIKYKYMCQEMEKLCFVDETHGLLSVGEITSICANVLSQYPISYCYLFGSYAKGTATESSDIDLLVSGEVTGMKFYGLVEHLRESLHKSVDVLDMNQLLDNPELLNEVLTDGIKIYGEPKNR